MVLATARHPRPRRAFPQRVGNESRVDRSWIESLLSESTKINQQARTFVRATSAWDPKYKGIVPPGVCRQAPIRYLDRYTIMADLIEGARANLLIPGHSENLSLWGSSTATFTYGAPALDGSPTATIVTSGTLGGDIRAQENITVPNDGLTRTLSIHLLKTSGNPTFYPAIKIQLVGGAGVTALAVFNPTTGVVTGSFGGTTQVQSVGIWWRLSISILNNTSGNVTMAMEAYPAYSSDGTTTQSNQIGSTVFCWAQAEVGPFPSSYISNRNILTHTNLLTTGWTPSSATVTPGQPGDPFGGSNASSMVEAAATAQHHTINPCSPTSGQTITFSCYAKAGTRSFLRMSAFDTVDHNSWFNLANGTLGTVSAGNTSTITPVIGMPGWYHCTLTRVATGTTFFGIVGMSNADNVSSYLGDGISNILVCAPQYEYGTTATAYWGVNATVGGRDADTLTVSLAGLAGGGLATDKGTLVGYLVPSGWSTSPGGVVPKLCDDNVTSGLALLQYTSGGLGQCARWDSVSDKSVSGPVSLPANGVPIQVSMTWNSSLSVFVNGVAGGTIAGAPPWLTSTAMVIGSQPGGGNFYAFGYVAILYQPRDWTALEQSLVGSASIAAP